MFCSDDKDFILFRRKIGRDFVEAGTKYLKEIMEAETFPEPERSVRIRKAKDDFKPHNQRYAKMLKEGRR